MNPLIRIVVTLSLATAATAFAQASNFVLPAVPKDAVFNVPVNLNNLPPQYFTSVDVNCSVHSATPPNDSNGLAYGGEKVTLVGGAYNGMVKVTVKVQATDVAKAKGWWCRLLGNGPTMSSFNMDFWQNLPNDAKPASGTSPKTSASGVYN